MNRIQNKDHRIGILFHQNIIQQNAIVLLCRRNIYIKNSGYGGLAPGY